jgi:putative transposase
MAILNILKKEVSQMSFASSIFNQFLSLIQKSEFDKIAQKHDKARKSRKFCLWSQFVYLMFIQITERKSLRAGIRNMNVSKKQIYHLGAKTAPKSTFSDANNKRPAAFFEALFNKLFEKASSIAPKHGLPFANRLYSLDATIVDLNKSNFPWAFFRKNKSGIKLHTLLDHNGYLPSVVRITDAKTHDVQKARTLHLEKGAIVVFDRAYVDYDWFVQLQENEVTFVTRLKTNAKYTVTNRYSGDKEQGVTSDQAIRFDSKPGLALRRIGYKDPETGKHYKFLTNNFSLKAKTIADIYRERWEVEVFFRWIKQNLKIKTFVGRSENAVLMQIYVALILYLLLALLKFQSKTQLSMQQMLQILQLNLFHRGRIEELFNPPANIKISNKNRQLPLPS